MATRTTVRARRKSGLLYIIWLRILLATILVFSTYNPSGWSYAHWIANGFTAGVPLSMWAFKVLLGLVLLALWFAYINITWKAMRMGTILVAGILALATYAILQTAGATLSLGALAWLSNLLLAVLLGLGAAWGYVKLWFAGTRQVDLEEV